MRYLACVLLCIVGCASPEKVVVMDAGGSAGFGCNDSMIREEWKCPKCGKQHKTKYLAQKCIDSHD